MTGLLGTVVVLVVAAAVGVLVYRLTAGDGRPADDQDQALPGTGADVSEWRGETDTASDGGGDASTVPEGYIPVAPGAPSWHSRLGGLMGLVIAVGAGAIALALALYAIGELIARLVSSAGESTPPGA